MFNQVRADMCAACIQSVQPFPDDMLELQEEATKYTNPDDEIWTLGILATRCATLFAGIVGKNQGLPLPVSWNDFVKEAIDLQDCFQAVFDQLAILEPYVTIQEPVTPVSSRLRSGFVAYKGRYDIYRTSWAIRLWNNSRMIEIIVCEMVCWLINKVLTIDADTAAGAASGGIAGGVSGGVVTLPALPSHGIDRAKLKARMQYTADLISLRGEEILMSIPQGLGLVYIPGSEEPGNQYSGVNVSGGYMLTWHLYTVGKSPVITAEDRKWVIDRLKGVGDSAGIDMAWQLAEDLVKIEHGIMYQVSRG